MKLRCLGLALLATFSFSTLAKVSIEEMENRVKFIEKIGVAAPSLSVEAYQRELEYERQGLPLEVRAKHEARLLAEQVKDQIVTAFERAVNVHGDPARAAAEVEEAINRDLELAAPEFRKELLALSKQALLEAQQGGVASTGSLKNLERAILPNVALRSKYLNQEVMDASIPPQPQEDWVPSANSGKDSERLEYGSVKEFIESLVSDRENTRWVSTSNKTITTGETITSEANISYQVKIEFMGVALEAGPTINFRREYVTAAIIMAEELNPIITPDGNFDTHKRDQRGKIIYKNGKPQRRFLAFYCSVELRFATDYKGSGGFKVAGIGAGGTVMDTYHNTVTHNSRRILLPDYVGGKTMSVQRLASICQKDFLKAKLNQNLTVEKSLNIEMKNLVSGLRFSHNKTKCAVDTHCIDWFNKEVIAIWTYGTYPRCVEEPREKYRACALKGLEGMSCPVYKNGKLISTGRWEVECDKGLKCVQTEAEGWLKYAKGKCMPINPKTYRDPKKYPEYPTSRDYIEVELIDLN